MQTKQIIDNTLYIGLTFVWNGLPLKARILEKRSLLLVFLS